MARRRQGAPPGRIIDAMSFSTVFVLLEWVRADQLQPALSAVASAGPALYADELLDCPAPAVVVGQVGSWTLIFLPQRYANVLADEALFCRLSAGRRAFGASLQSEPLQVGLTFAEQGALRRRAVWTNGLLVHASGAPLLGEEASEIPDESLVIDLMERHANVRWAELEGATLVRLIPHAGLKNRDVIAALVDVVSPR